MDFYQPLPVEASHVDAALAACLKHRNHLAGALEREDKHLLLDDKKYAVLNLKQGLKPLWRFNTAKTNP